jgi:Transposase zinc-ribbon domain
MPEVYPRNQPELEKQFENEADCRSYLEALRWPDGYRCPKCAGSALLGTHQGAVSDAHLNAYLAEFTFRFNRRKSASTGKLFYRLAKQALQVGPTPIVKPQDVGSPESHK